MDFPVSLSARSTLPKGSSPPVATRFPRPLALLVVVIGSAPWWLPIVGLYPYLAVEIAIFMLYAQGYNLLLGTSGLPSFGHGAFFGIGAYAFGLAQKHVAVNLWLDLACGIAAAALAGALVAAFISHRRGIYYALLTIAFGQLAWFIAIKWHSVTGGEDGLLNLKRPPVDLGFVQLSITSNEALLLFTLAALVIVVLGCWRFVHAPAGRVLAAIRQNEMRARFIGYRVWAFKFAVFVMSTAIAGLAGSLFAMAQQSAYPNVMSLHQSGFVVMMVLIGGGLASFWGPIIGAAFFILARDLLGAYTETWLLWYGLAFIAIVLWKPEGLAGIGKSMLERLRVPQRLRHGES
ncbi:MAG TPA: branched-chain amino acid ABC transporter permease [Casimicrobiaceae bacterium]|nr:branched-chain amino acid ABC transporter permease [Casimicrobiaceae bacterium]